MEEWLVPAASLLTDDNFFNQISTVYANDSGENDDVSPNVYFTPVKWQWCGNTGTVLDTKEDET